MLLSWVLILVTNKSTLRHQCSPHFSSEVAAQVTRMSSAPIAQESPSLSRGLSYPRVVLPFIVNGICWMKRWVWQGSSPDLLNTLVGTNACKVLIQHHPLSSWMQRRGWLTALLSHLWWYMMIKSHVIIFHMPWSQLWHWKRIGKGQLEQICTVKTVQRSTVSVKLISAGRY